MCGIAGFWAKTNDEQIIGKIDKMTSSLKHRGPDDFGSLSFHSLNDGFLVLGHRRLSIIDLSATGHQPMSSASGRYHIVFNGEIYNFRALQNILRSIGYPFCGHSDTEVILACCDEWGFIETLKRIRGMFAFALWDQQDQVLHLCRDPMGEKPLYYGWTSEGFIFASELGAIAQVSNLELCWPALRCFLRYAYVPCPWSAYSGIFKLPAGTYLTLSTDQMQNHQDFSPYAEKAGFAPVRYWDLFRSATEGREDPFIDEKIAVNFLDALLNESVEKLRIADVPLGTFLSGGIDSTLVTAIAAAQSQKPIQTFTIGFTDPRFNEAQFAAEIANHLGTNHTEHYIDEEDLLELVPQINQLYTEPFADASQLPSVLISRIARQKVTVCLSGDGGDELFGGYNRYLFPKRVFRKMQPYPLFIRRYLSRLLNNIPSGSIDNIYNCMKKISGQEYGQANVGQKLHKLASLIKTSDLYKGYHKLISAWPPPLGNMEDPLFPRDNIAFEEWAMLRDQLSYLPDDNLAKVDRASMSASLETRLPLLTREIIEFAWRVPLIMKIRNGQSKWILRQVLFRYVPKDLIERPKMGFSVPTGRWLRSSLKSWAEGLIRYGHLEHSGNLPMEDIQNAWDLHQTGKKDYGHRLWTALILLQWLGKF